MNQNLKKLGRAQLLQLLIEQSNENETLRSQLEAQPESGELEGLRKELESARKTNAMLYNTAMAAKRDVAQWPEEQNDTLKELVVLLQDARKTAAETKSQLAGMQSALQAQTEKLQALETAQKNMPFAGSPMGEPLGASAQYVDILETARRAADAYAQEVEKKMHEQLAKAQMQASAIVQSANEQAQGIVSQAQNRAKEIMQTTQKQNAEVRKRTSDALAALRLLMEQPAENDWAESADAMAGISEPLQDKTDEQEKTKEDSL